MEFYENALKTQIKYAKKDHPDSNNKKTTIFYNNSTISYAMLFSL